MKDRHGEMTRKMREGATWPAVSDPQECRGLHAPAHRARSPSAPLAPGFAQRKPNASHG